MSEAQAEIARLQAEVARLRAQADGLTPRELEVLRLLAAGETTKGAAKRMHLSAHTIKDFATSLRRKLGARNTVHAAVIAAQKGLL